MTFDGFSNEGLALLGRLPTMDKKAFQARKKTYQAELQEPLKAFVDALGPVLQEQISDGLDFAAKTHGSIGPINNDVRFNPDAPTYKDHVLLRFWEGADKKAAPTLYVRLTPTEVGFAAGAMVADVEAWRRAVDADGDALQAALTALVAATDAGVVGQELKRVPKGYDPDHRHADLLRHKWLQARWPRPMPDTPDGDAFVRWCAGELAQAAGVHRWLVEHLA
ncbi:MAG: DUF2461 family protein [Longimicrobiales bacterium]